MQHRLSFLIVGLSSLVFLVGCVDKTGLLAESHRGPHTKSNAASPIIIHEFADLQCPACRAAQAKIVAPLLREYGPKIRFEFKHFPILSLHRYAMEAAQASECAADQGKFWEFVELAYEKQPALKREILPHWAEGLGLDVPLFERCLKSRIKKEVVLADYEEGKSVGVKGTPTFFVNGERTESDIDAITDAVDALVKNVRQKL